MMEQFIVETKKLTKKFKTAVAVNEVNLQIKQGAIYGFLGPNGAGKTTAIKLILGLMKQTSGSVTIFGKDFTKEKLSILRDIGSLVESPSYYGHLTARENLEIIRTILQVPKSRIEEVLQIVRLEKDADREVKGFSLGMKQRLGIASASTRINTSLSSMGIMSLSSFSSLRVPYVQITSTGSFKTAFTRFRSLVPSTIRILSHMTMSLLSLSSFHLL